MGIYDRDYSRAGSGSVQASPFAFRGWSVNTWLIVVCTAVFMLNALLPRTAIPNGPWQPISDQIGEVNERSLTRGDIKSLQYRPIMGKNKEGQTVQVAAEAFAPIYMKLDDGKSVQVGRQPVMIDGWLFKWGYFSTARALVSWDSTIGFIGFEFWRFITFQFLHANLTHLLFNMIGLFFFGSVVERFLGSKRYVAFYLLCGILGACTYLLLNVIGLGVYKMTGQDSMPLLLFNNPETVLVGASAGVFGVIMASAYLMPNATVYLFLVLPMKLATLAYGLVIFALLAVFFGWNNAGGEAAHIGGAVAGFYFIRHTQHLHGFFDLLGRVDPTSKSKAKRRMTNRSDGKKASMVDEAEIDRILSKIHEKGLASLTEKEKKILHKASGR